MNNLEGGIGIPHSKRPENTKNDKEAEASFSKESIKKLYDKGRFLILSSILLFSRPTNAQINIDTNNLKENKEVYDDTTGLINSENTYDFSKSNNKDTSIIESVKDPEYKKRLKALNKMFSFEGTRFTEGDLQIDSTSGKSLLLDSVIWQNIVEIRKEFPRKHKPDINFLPTNNLDKLLDPSYVETMKYFAKLRMTGYQSQFTDAFFEETKEDSSIFKALEKLNGLGAHLDFEIFAYMQHYGGIDQVNNFLENNKNKNLLHLFKDAPVGYNEMYMLATDDPEGHIYDFLNNDDNKKIIKKLNKNGYTFAGILGMRKYLSLLQDNTFMQALELLSKKIPSQIKSSWRIQHVISGLESYYDFSSKEDLERLMFDLLFIVKQNPSKKDQDIMSYLVEDNRFKVINNIFSPLVANFDKTKTNEFLQDPALDIIYKLNYNSIPPNFLDTLPENEQSEWLMRIARNMYEMNLPITHKNFEQTFYETLELRLDKNLLEKSLFKNRNIAFFENNEKSKAGFDRFGTKQTKESILKQAPLNLSEFRAENNSSSLKKTKDDFLRYISTQPNLTIIVDAHGGPSTIFLSEGQSNEKNNAEKINYEDIFVECKQIAEALETRYDNGVLDTAMLIMSSCYNQDFIRNLSRFIKDINRSKNKQIPIPICMGDTEYGQYAFSDFSNTHGNIFFDAILCDKNDTKIKDVLELEDISKKLKNINISIFVPKEAPLSESQRQGMKRSSILFQISENTNQSPLERVFNLKPIDISERIKNKNV